MLNNRFTVDQQSHMFITNLLKTLYIEMLFYNVSHVFVFEILTNMMFIIFYNCNPYVDLIMGTEQQEEYTNKKKSNC